MDTVTKICTAAIIIVALVGDFVLTWHGSVSGGQCLGFAVGIIGVPLGSVATVSTVKAALNANPPSPPA